ncbi:hypothetical protein MSAN_00779800 [Mycena sanguinolenta]|uniref:Uncharacterized protein n=1 Tax=Mycena sanguinolenta TaxID=230812 RepID=A0A8H6Z2I9_9AGAR|nr:hypothetical protein MSAN_00779800 [Mycena sanguinolenta]
MHLGVLKHPTQTPPAPPPQFLPSRAPRSSPPSQPPPRLPSPRSYTLAVDLSVGSARALEDTPSRARSTTCRLREHLCADETASRALTLAAPNTSEESRVVRLTVENAAIVSVEYEVSVRVVLTVILATGCVCPSLPLLSFDYFALIPRLTIWHSGYAASLIASRAQHVLDLLAVATTNGDHALAPTPLSRRRSSPQPRCATSRMCKSFVDPTRAGTKTKVFGALDRRWSSHPDAQTHFLAPPRR